MRQDLICTAAEVISMAHQLQYSTEGGVNLVFQHLMQLLPYYMTGTLCKAVDENSPPGTSRSRKAPWL